MSSSSAVTGPPDQVDVDQVDARGVRCAAAITTVVIALALITPDPTRWVLVGAQALAFGFAAAFGVRNAPYGLLYARFVRPRLTGPPPLEDAAAPRFAQFVGFVFLSAALLAFAVGAHAGAMILVGFAFVAAALNATVGLCLGCEVYLLVRRLGSSQS